MDMLEIIVKTATHKVVTMQVEEFIDYPTKSSRRWNIVVHEGDKQSVMSELWANEIDAYDHSGEFNRFYVNIP